jgi:hypothetical protein
MPDNASTNGNGGAAQNGAPKSAASTVLRALICPHCRKGRLDPTGKRPGEAVTCPACGGATKATLEMTLGAERLLQRQSQRDRSKRTFGELNEEEKLEFIGKQSTVQQMYYFLLLRLGPRGLIGVYLGLFVLFGGLILTYLLTFGGYTLRSVPWWVWPLAVLGGGLLGLVGWFVHGTVMHYYQKGKAAAAAADPRRSGASSRRAAATTVRTRTPSSTSTPARRAGSSRNNAKR